MMISNTSLARFSSRTAAPSTFASETREAFARAAVFAEFGRHAWAIDQTNFIDRPPGASVWRAPEAGLK